MNTHYRRYYLIAALSAVAFVLAMFQPATILGAYCAFFAAVGAVLQRGLEVWVSKNER